MFQHTLNLWYHSFTFFLPVLIIQLAEVGREGSAGATGPDECISIDIYCALDLLVPRSGVWRWKMFCAF